MAKSTDYANLYEQHEKENVGNYRYKPQIDKRSEILLLIISFIIAFSIWMYVVSVESPTSEHIITLVPVTIHQLDDELPVYSGANHTVDVKIMGKKSEIDILTSNDVEAYVDATEINKPGRYTLEVKINLPSGITLVEQSITTVSVYFDTKSSITVPVKAKLTGYQIPEGYELGESDIKLSIDEVTVTGPKALLETVDCAMARIVLGQVTASVKAAGTLEPVDANGDVVNNAYIKLQTTDVTADIPVYQYKTVPFEVDYKYGYYNSNNVNIRIQPSQIRLKGEAAALRDITSILLTTIDEKKVITDIITASVMLPPDVTSVDKIETAVIEIKHTDTITKDIVVDNIIVDNPNNFSYELVDDSINVTLRGQSQYVNYIPASSISASIDLSALSTASGTISVVVNIAIKEPYSKHLYPIGDYRMSVRIK